MREGVKNEEKKKVDRLKQGKTHVQYCIHI